MSWNSDRACDPAYVASHYIAAADHLTYTVALDPHRDGVVLGFQSLKLAQAKNIYDVAPGWGVIGTYVALDTGRKGIGRRLFDATLTIAQQVGYDRKTVTKYLERSLEARYDDLRAA